MKIKTMLYCGLFVFALLICSCSKSKNDDPVFSGPLIKTIMIRFSDSNFYDHTLYYDANSRIAEMDLTHTLGAKLTHIKTIYKYGTDSVIASYYDTDAQVLLKSEIYLLNASGQAVQGSRGKSGGERYLSIKFRFHISDFTFQISQSLPQFLSSFLMLSH